MKFSVKISAVAFSTLMLFGFGSAEAQAPKAPVKKTKMGAAEILAACKVGQWVQMEGIIQKDFTVMCMDVKIITGPVKKASITAPARSLDPAKKEFKLLLVPIKTNDATEYENDADTFKKFGDLKAGMLVEVDGPFGLEKDGSFLAAEVEDVSAELNGQPELSNAVEMVGKIEKVNPAKQTITVMGVVYQLHDKSEGVMAIK